MLEIWGVPVPTPLERSGPNLIPTVYAYMPNFTSISSLYCQWEAKTRKFYRFLTLLFCRGSAQRCRDKAECVCTSTNILLSNDTKTVSEFQRVCGEVAFTNFVIQKRDGQTKNKQKTLNFFAPPWRPAISELHQTRYDDRGGPYVSFKTCLPLTHSFATRGRTDRQTDRHTTTTYTALA